MAEIALKVGAKRVRLMLDSYHDDLFGTQWTPTKERKFDVVMLSNLVYVRGIPNLSLPGGLKRRELARRFHRFFGDRFALFGTGKGWDGEAYCRGPIPYEEQEKYIRSAWLTVGFDNFSGIAMYSSDRIPISLACGVPHITNYKRGYEHLYYSNTPGLNVVKTTSEAIDVALYIMSISIEERIELGKSVGKFCKEKPYSIRYL